MSIEVLKHHRLDNFRSQSSARIRRVFIVGASASGKSTLWRTLYSLTNAKVAFRIRFTSRLFRSDDDMIENQHLDEEKFDEHFKNGLLEFYWPKFLPTGNEYYGFGVCNAPIAIYGCNNEFILNAKHLKTQNDLLSNSIIVFVKCSPEERAQRLKARDDLNPLSQIEMDYRLGATDDEVKVGDSCDIIFNNNDKDDLQKNAKKLLKLLFGSEGTNNVDKTIGKANLDHAVLKRLGTEIPQALYELHTLLTILKSFGIIAAYRQLDQAEVTPEACLKLAAHTLDLLAFHGHKWLFENWFESHLQRLALRHGKVRFLLSDSSDSKTITKCQQLMERHSKVFSAKIYTDLPTFRAVLIDDRLLVLSHYGYEVIEQDSQNLQGWMSPQLLIEENRDWSLLIPFRELFHQIWENAKNIRDPEPTSNVIKREFKAKHQEGQ